MFFKQLLQSSTIRLALIALVLCGITLVSGRSTEVAFAAVQVSDSIAVQQANNSPNVINQPSGTERHFCNVFEAGDGFTTDGQEVIVVGCTPSAGAFTWFSISATDSKRVARILSIALTAKATGQHIYIDYDPAANPSPLCDPAMCRRIVGIGIREP